MKRTFFIILFCFLVLGKDQLSAQEPNFNCVLSDYIGTVTFHLKELALGDPIIRLNSSSRLELRFDDLGANDQDYIYKVEHCDANWQPSNLDELDYIRGFNGEPISNFDLSFATRTQFTQYRLELPNANLEFKVSGNYLLKIYEDTDEQALVLVRRFMVTESSMQVVGGFRGRATGGKWESHQELEFEVVHKGVKVLNPLTDIKATVLQNARWDNALVAIKPNLVRSQSVVFDGQGKMVFPGGKEFRRLDLRSLQYGSGKIGEIVQLDNGYEVYLKPEKKRAYGSYFTRQDINGKYIIENLDVRPGGSVISFDLGGNEPDEEAYVDLSSELPFTIEEIRRVDQDNQLRGDYAEVFFFLISPTEFENTDVYLFGGFSDWSLLNGYKMSYNDKYKAYEGRAFLKQGYYEYYYVTVPNGTKKVTLDDTEGSHSQTENSYTILVYYRPFGERYDRLVAVRTISSRE